MIDKIRYYKGSFRTTEDLPHEPPIAHYRKYLSCIEQNLSSQVLNLLHCGRFRYLIIRFAMKTVKHNREK